MTIRSNITSRLSILALALSLLVGAVACKQWLRIGLKAGGPFDKDQGAQAHVRKRRSTFSTEMRGMWVSNVDSNVMDSFGNMESLAARVSNLNMNALYPVVWNKGETFYPSDVMMRYGAPKISSRYGLGDLKRDPMADWMTLGNNYDLDIIPWFEWGLKVPAQSALASKNPSWLSRDQSGKTVFDQDGTSSVYLNYINSDVQQFYESLVVEFVAKYEVPAIQFDDHLSLKNTFGYDDYSLNLYFKETGQNARPAPDSPEWLAWRAGKLTQFVARISRAMKTARPGVKLSVSPNPYPWSFQNYVQDWPSWVEQGLVDEVVVQVYRDDLTRFQTELRNPILSKVKVKSSLSIGILSGLRTDPMPISMVRSQTDFVRSMGYAGVVYFFQESLLKYTAEGETIDSRINAIKQVFPQPAKTP